MRLIKPAVVLTLILSIGGASWWFYALSKAELKIKTVQLELQQQELSVVVEFLVTKIPVMDYDLEYQASWKDKKLAEGRLQIEAKEIRETGTDISLPITFLLDDLRELWKNRTTEQEIIFSGAFRTSVAEQKIELPFSFTKKIPPLPQQSPKDIVVQKLTVDILEEDIVLLAEVLVENPKDKDISELNVVYEVFLEKTVIAEGRITTDGLLARSEGIVSIPVKIFKKRFLDTKSKLQSAGEILVKGQIEAQVGEHSLKLPFTIKKTIVLNSKNFTANIQHLNIQQPLSGPVIINAQVVLESEKPQKLQSGMVKYQFAINEQSIAQGSLQIKQHQSNQLLLDLPVEIDAQKIQEIQANATEPYLPLTITGTAQLQLQDRWIHLPFEVRKNLVLRDRQKPSYKFNKLTILVEEKFLNVDAILEIKNPGDKEIRRLQADYRVLCDKEMLLQGKALLKNPIAPSGVGTVAIPVRINTATVKNLKQSQEIARTITITGSLQVETATRNMSVPFEISKEVLLKPQNAKAQIQNVRLRSNRDGSINLEAFIEITNTKPKEADITYQVVLAGILVASGRITLQPHQDGIQGYIPIAIEAQKLNEIKQQKGGQYVPLVITGKADIQQQQQTISVPFEIQKTMLLSSPKREVRISDVKISEEGLEKKILLLLEVSPAPQISDLQVDYRIAMNDEMIASGKVKQAKNLGEGVFEIPLTVQHKKLEAIKIENIGKFVAIKIQGVLQGTSPRGAIKIPFEVEKETQLQGKSLEIQGVNVQILKMSRDYMELNLNLKVFSKFAKEIKKLRISYHKIVEGTEVMTGEVQIDDLQPQKINTIRIPIRIARKTWKDIKKQYDGQMLPMTLKGNIEVETAEKNFDFPFEVQKETLIRERPFKIKLKKFRIKKWRFREKTYYIVVTLESLLPHKVDNLKIEGDIEIFKGGKIKILNENITLQPNAKSDLEIEIKRERVGILRRIADKIGGKTQTAKTDLWIHGTTEDGTEFSSYNDEQHTMDVEEEKD